MRRLFILSVFLGLFSCHKRLPAGMTLGTLTDGVGCSTVLIQVNQYIAFQPGNLDSFPAVTQKLGQQVLFSYTELDNATVCMDGPPIRLNTIRNY
jgi:hypothetical protein